MNSVKIDPFRDVYYPSKTLMSYLANEQNYLELINQFSDRKIDAEVFCQKWLSLWSIDRDEQYALTNSWSERYDLKLKDALNRNEITAEEFERKWVELYGYGDYKHLLELVDRIFTACDVFSPKPENEYEIDEKGLRNEIKSHLVTYETTKSKLSKF